MTQHDDKSFQAYLHGDSEISELYQRTSRDQPSTQLDHAILTQAQKAVQSDATAAVRRPSWLAPVGLAATVVLGISLAFNLKDYSPSSDRVLMERAGSESVLAHQPKKKDDSKKVQTQTAPRPAPPVLAKELEALDIDETVDIETVDSDASNADVADLNTNFGMSIERQAQPASPTPLQTVSAAGASTESPTESPQVSVDQAPSESVTIDQSTVRRYRSTQAQIERTPNVDGNRGVNRPLSPDGGAADSADDESDADGHFTAALNEPREETAGTAESFKTEREDDRLRQWPEQALTTLSAFERFTCELKQQGIVEAVIEDRIVRSRTRFDPPLNANTWLVAIADLADRSNYFEACAYLAAYQRIFPDTIIPFDLPVVIPHAIDP